MISFICFHADAWNHLLINVYYDEPDSWSFSRLHIYVNGGLYDFYDFGNQEKTLQTAVAYFCGNNDPDNLNTTPLVGATMDITQVALFNQSRAVISQEDEEPPLGK